MGNFKKKPRYCKTCNRTWIGHEEKESDVCLAVTLVKEAVKNSFDLALIISADSDIAPAIRTVKELTPEKKVKILIPPDLFCPFELLQLADKKHAKIKSIHLERSLFPEKIVDADQNVVTRPSKYHPPGE